MSASRQSVLEALGKVLYPGFTKDIVTLGVVRQVVVEGGVVLLELDPGSLGPKLLQSIEADLRAALAGLEGIHEVKLRLPRSAASSPGLETIGRKRSVAAAGALDGGLIPDVRHVIAVASGKGGVGKSTIAVNLAVALARQGARTGLLDADIYGPSIPLMMGVDAQPELTEERRILPFERFGVRLMSLGFLIPQDSAVIWRGPMVMKALEQLLRDVVWGELDYLVVDLPPGTGDAQLTLSQKVRLAGAVIVTTPQDVALADARKGVAMFAKVNVPVLGIIENMSYFLCPHCEGRTEIFGHGGGRKEAARLGVPCLGEVPLDPTIRRGGDAGAPIVDAEPDSPQARTILAIAARVREIVEAPPESEGPGGDVFARFRKAINPKNA